MTTPASIPGVNSAFAMNGAASPNELFALTDEQILEIEPDAFGGQSSTAANDANLSVIPSEARNLSLSRTGEAAQQSRRDSSVALLPRNDGTQPLARGTSHEPQITSHDAEPPPWLATQMNDPWSGEEARELWNGVQHAQQEAAAYREVFAKPEDARALKELYPGGVEQARATAERARTLEEIDSAFYGGAGKSPEQLSAGRTALAQRMLREDPVAFREMVFAGLRALEEAAQTPSSFAETLSASATAPTRSATSENLGPSTPNVVPPFRAASSAREEAGLKPSTTQTGANHAPSPAAENHAQLGQYQAFEKSANEELERSVGGAIDRTLAQALPDVQHGDSGPSVGARYIVPLQQRLGGAIRADVESALKGDRQLGEQIAQVLSARRFDDTTRAQVVRLINDRAQQLVPSAARRVIQEWTQAALATHRARTQTSDSTRDRSNVEPNATANNSASASNASAPRSEATQSISARATAADRAENAVRHTASSARNAVRHGVDYRKLSDEQILEL